MQKGGRNLMLLGLGATLIACTTTGISLAIYHKSGDIYLDRSRPGFLPDEEEVEEEELKEEVKDYDFKQNDHLSKEALEEYLENIQNEINAIDAYKEPFNGRILSDEELGIPLAE
jgi:hypothetical protein